MKQKRKTLKKKQKNNVLPNKVFIPKTNQEIISYMFKEVDERTGIFRIDEDTYSICIEYSDVSCGICRLVWFFLFDKDGYGCNPSGSVYS